MVTSNIEKLLHVFQFGREPVVRQAVEEHLAVPLLGDSVIQQHQYAAVRLAANQPSEPLFQRDGGLRNLIIVKWIPARLAYALDAGTRSEERRVGKEGRSRWAPD